VALSVSQANTSFSGTKMEIVRHAESGEALALIGGTLNLSQSTVQSVVKEKDKFKEYVQNASNISS
jgi:DNA-binding NarL/FixJ family response regulator